MAHGSGRRTLTRVAERIRSVPRLSTPWRLAVAPAATLAVFLFQLAVLPSPTVAPFVFFYVAIVVATWFGGRGSGLAAVALSALAANRAFIPPLREWSIDGPAVIATCLFAVAGSLVAVLCGEFRHALVLAGHTAAKLRAQREAHQRTAERLSLALKAGRSGSFEWDAKTNTNVWSDELLALYGIGRSEFGGRYEDWIECLLPEDREAGAAAVKESLETGAFAFEFRIVRRDTGEIRWMHGRGQVFFDEAHQPARMVGINVDVTERKEVQEELRREREHAQQLARFPEENPDPVLRLSSDLGVLYANPAARSSLGLGPADPLPESILESAREALEFRRAVRAEIPFGDRVFSFRFVPVGSEVNVFGHEVTDRKRIEQALRASEQRVRGMFEKAALGIAEIDTDDRLGAVNDRMCEILGYRREELLGRTVGEITAPEDRPISEKLNAELRDGLRDRFGYEKRYLRHDGARLWVHVTVSALRDDGGTYRGAIGTVEDVSGRKAAEAERDGLIRALRDADRRKDDFLGMLSHELRNPLAPIRNSLHILRRAAPGGEQATRAVAVIDRQVHHATRLVDDLLDVTRITRGKVRLQREGVDLRGLGVRTSEDHRQLFEKNGLRLEVRVPAEPVIVNADATRLTQMMGNLLQNALKFTPRGGHATLTVDRSQDFATVTVRDTGSGISRDVLAHLFEPFVQADSTLDRSAGGLGLGLALVKGLAELHGGTVSAHSDGVGKGASFTIRLPLERHGTPRLTLVPAPPATRSARRVLIIEDNIDAAESLKEALQLNGHEVETALSSSEGLDKVRALKPDVVLCDIGLPGMDGFQVAKAIRADPTVSGVPMIALSGYAQAEDLERSKEAGFDLHLTKPPDLEALERAIGEARESGAGSSTA